jgi:signal transduction histidine kinase
MNYGRPLKLRRTEVIYRELLSKVLPVLQSRLTEQHVVVVLQIPEDLPPLWIDGELFRNCILNFVTNASQAMPDGGTITLGALVDNGQVKLTFSDQGRGISPDDISKIFQPYFTTKDVGIGLGLAITERIIKEHGGEIMVESSLDVGTTITVTVPQQPTET